MERWQGRVALVTGGSKGIGAAIVSALLEHDMKVFACARDIDPILQKGKDKMGPGELNALQCDIQNETEILKMFEDIHSKAGKLDVLINNCACYLPGELISASTDNMRAMLDINVLALAICTREAVKSMRDRGVNDGHIIHINSSSGQRVSSNPPSHFYSATKFAVTAMTEGLRQELRQLNSNIRVSNICPGVTETPGLNNFHSKEQKERLLTKLGNIVLEPKDVAASVIHVLGAPAHVQIHELTVRPMFH